MNKKRIQWRTIIGLILVYLAFFLNLNWLWGVLFLIWVIPDLRSGVSYFMEPVYKAEQPVLYWVIMASWLLMSFYLMASLFVSWFELFISLVQKSELGSLAPFSMVFPSII